MARVNCGLPRPTEITVVDPKQLLRDDGPPEINPATGVPKELRAYVVMTEPKMTVVPHCFSDVECDHLLKLVEGNWVPSLVGSAKGDQDKAQEKTLIKNNLSQNRTSWSCQTRYSQTDVLERLEHRLASIAGLPVTQLERLNMVRYTPGEYFNEHHDGKFRPRTVFVYLNDLPEEDDAGDTFFPFLGISFRPRRGTAVVWSNALPCGKEDSRMLHAGRAPAVGVKYGANCFFNEKELRVFVSMEGLGCGLEDARTVDIPSHCKDEQEEGQGATDEAKPISVCTLSEDPQFSAVHAFLTPAEADSLLREAGYDERAPPPLGEGPFAEGTETLRIFEAQETPTVTSVELRLCAVTAHDLNHMTRLRLVRPGTQLGMCNRGPGTYSAYICLSERDEIFFPHLGWRLVLQKGDMLAWANIQFGKEVSYEDLRTQRVHVGQAPAVGLDAFYLDNPVRAQQAQRTWVADEHFPSA